jgi:hypothetical protein
MRFFISEDPQPKVALEVVTVISADANDLIFEEIA